MADFADGLSDERAGRDLGRAIQGKGAFRRFKDQLHREHSDLVSVWHAFRQVRAERRAVEWLVDQGLVDAEVAHRFHVDHPDPALP